MARPKSKTKKILFAVEIIVLLLFIGGLYVYGQLNSKLDKINQPVLDDSKIKVNQEVQDSIDSQESTLTGYTTYALFGIDHRDKNTALGGENSDTIIIASVNNDTKDVKLVSVYRDTLLNLGNDTYSKANAAYAYGEAEQAITMLNTNLDLNISEYATVNFNALTTIIDDLGGLDMDMSYAEIVHMNNYCVETSEETGKDYTPIELPDRPDDIEAVQYHYHLNGVQATSYCRIRYTASLDMGRTERQRRVIQMIVDKANGFTDPSFIPNLGASANGVASVVEFNPDLTNGVEINEDFKKVYNVNMNGHSAESYTVVWLFKTAIEKAGSTDGAAVRDALAELSIDGAFEGGRKIVLPYSKIEFAPEYEIGGAKHYRDNTYASVAIAQVQDQEWKTVWPFEFASSKIQEVTLG